MDRAAVIPPGGGVRLSNVEFLGLSEHSPRAHGPEAHVHADEDDAFYILDGQLTFVLDEGELPAPAGFDRRLLGE